MAICIGFGLLADFHYWKIAFKENDYKFCDPIIFYMAYGLNIIDYIIFLGYAITIVSNHYCSHEIYCCGEIVKYLIELCIDKIILMNKRMKSTYAFS